MNSSDADWFAGHAAITKAAIITSSARMSTRPKAISWRPKNRFGGVQSGFDNSAYQGPARHWPPNHAAPATGATKCSSEAI
jgi:hypothetical protein